MAHSYEPCDQMDAIQSCSVVRMRLKIFNVFNIDIIGKIRCI